MELHHITENVPSQLRQNPMPSPNSNKIFTPKAVSAFRRFISWRRPTQSVLCEWGSGVGGRTEVITLTITKSFRKIITYYFNISLTLIYALYLSLQLIYRLHLCSSSLSNSNVAQQSQCNVVDTLWTFLWGVYFVWAFGNYVNAIKKQRDAIHFISGMSQLDNYFSDSLGKNLPKKNAYLGIDMIEGMLWIYDFMVLSFATCGAVMALALSHKPAFIAWLWVPASHTLAGTGYLELMNALIFAAAQFYLIAATCGGLMFFVSYLTIYMVFSGFWLNKLSAAAKQNGSQIQTLQNYRKLQILNTYFNRAHTTFIYPLTMGMYFSTSIFTFFGTVRFKELAPIVEYVLFPMACSFLLILFVFLLYGSASVYTSSAGVLEGLKGRFEPPGASSRMWTKRQIQALRPFGVQIGTLPYISKASILVVLAVWSNYSVSLLIAFPGSQFHVKE